MRTQEEINKEYSEYAMRYGDALFKSKQIPLIMADLEKRMTELHQEKASDAKGPELPAPPSKDSL